MSLDVCQRYERSNKEPHSSHSIFLKNTPSEKAGRKIVITSSPF